MASPEHSLNRMIYFGTFVHAVSLGKLEILEGAAIGVDENGIIAFIEVDVEERGVAKVLEKKYGWTDSVVVKRDENSTAYFFPGFIGQYTCFPHTRLSKLRSIL